MREVIVPIETDGREGNWYGASVGEIVRCADCEYFDTRKCKSQWPFQLDAYCYWGSRREE